jgi:hypothetical protein
MVASSVLVLANVRVRGPTAMCHQLNLCVEDNVNSRSAMQRVWGVERADKDRNCQEVRMRKQRMNTAVLDVVVDGTSKRQSIERVLRRFEGVAKSRDRSRGMREARPSHSSRVLSLSTTSILFVYESDILMLSETCDESCPVRLYSTSNAQSSVVAVIIPGLKCQRLVQLDALSAAQVLLAEPEIGLTDRFGSNFFEEDVVPMLLPVLLIDHSTTMWALR